MSPADGDREAVAAAEGSGRELRRAFGELGVCKDSERCVGLLRGVAAHSGFMMIAVWSDSVAFVLLLFACFSRPKPRTP